MKPKTYQVINEDGDILYALTLEKGNDDALFPISNELIGIQNLENNNFHYAIKSLNSDFKSDYLYKEFSTLHEGLIKARRYSEDAGEHKGIL